MGTTRRAGVVVLAMVVMTMMVMEVNGLVHKLRISGDERKQFRIESFGFLQGGYLSMKIMNWKIGSQNITADKKAAFYIHVTETDSTTFIDENATPGCLLDELQKNDDSGEGAALKKYFIQPSKEQANPAEVDFEIERIDQEGIYNIYFVSCETGKVSFTLYLEQYNVDSNGKKDFLSAGASPLPTLYGVFTAIYVGMLVVWIFGFMRAGTVNRVHYMMTVLVALYIFYLLFQAIEMHYTKTKGDPGGWQVAYFVFASLKTSFFFVLIALIGSGWTFVKPFLSEKDKKIIVVVIPLQILDNIAMSIVETTAPGSLGWLRWKDILRLVDIICCGAVLIPIIWSIKHLREASQIDGKVARNLQKLKLFRQFYLIVVSYIYFTRIIIYLLDATLPFKLQWMGDMFSELATLCFFLIVGHKFSPSDDNPYFKLDMDDDAARLEALEQRDDD